MANIVSSVSLKQAFKSSPCAWIIRLSLLSLLALHSVNVHALYSFPAAPGAPMPTGCTGTAGVYVCTISLNIQDQVQFLDTGNVSITVNGALTIGGYTIGSPTQSASVTFIPKGIVTMSTPTVYASINAGTNIILTTGTAFVKGNLTTSTGSITAMGTVTGNITAGTLGSIILLSNTVVNGNVAGTTGSVFLNSNAVVNGNISTGVGLITLSGGNNISSTINCSGCSLVVNGFNNVLGADISVGNVGGALSVNTTYNGSITANLSSIVLGIGSTVAGNVTATSTGLLGTSYISATQSVINGTVTATSQLAAQLFLYSGSVVQGAVQISNSGALLTATTTNVFVDSSSTINNSATVTGVIDNWGTIAGCARTTSGYIWAIAMQYNSTTAGVCCYNGSTCSTNSCVANAWNYKVNGCSTAANKFTCIDPSVTNSNASTGHLFTQVASASFSMDVAALAADGSVNTNYVSKGDASKTVTLKFMDCGDPSILANQNCTGTTTEILTQTLTFTGLDNGRKTVLTSIPNAYKNLRCQITDNNATTKTSLSTDNFSVRPASFTSVTSSNANADPTLGLNVTASPVIKAGSGFTLTASTGLSNYTGTPKIDPTKVLAHLGAINTGILSGTFSAANNGSASGSNFTYSETGYFAFNFYGVYDDTFTQVDSSAGDCASGLLPVGAMNACAFGYLPATLYYYGRFVPDHFTVTPGPSVTQACGAFSYYGQGSASSPGLTTPFILSAMNSTGAITQNYTASFATFTLANWNNYQFAATPLMGATLTSGLQSPAVTGSWLNGVANVIATHMLSKPATQIGPQTITFSAHPQYSDGGITVSSTQTTLSSAVTYLYGRLNIMNAHGSELLNLPINIEAQYWNGSAYVRSVTDSCTLIPLATVVMKNYKGNLNACETNLTGSTTMSNGKLGLKLTAPGISSSGQPNTGSVDLSINLTSALPGDKTCSSSIETSAIGGSSSLWFGPDPTARATFGVYKTPVVYFRESF
jgi:hypothetical protein